ncbi:2005_t:CDS:1, partial [Funneliformis geosporum]
KVESNTFEGWVKGGVFRSLGIEDDNLLNHQKAIFRYLSIRKKLTTLNNSLPFLDLTTRVSEENKVAINQREFESLGLYISYLSR